MASLTKFLPVLILAVPLGLIGYRVWQQRELLNAPAGGSGVVEGTEIALSARIAARVLELPLHEGDAVKMGDVLVRFDCADTNASVAEAHARLEAAKAQAVAAHAAADAAARAAAASKGASAVNRAQVGALSTQADAAARQAGRVDAMSGDVTAALLDQSHASADALAHQVQAARAGVDASTNQAQAAAQQATAAAATALAADESVKAGEAAASRVDLLAEECVIKAPRDGLLDALPYDVGELTAPGAVVARLVDLHEVKATFYLPNAELAAATPHRKAGVVADAYPERTYEGTISTVSTAAEFTPRNVQTRTDRDRLVFPVEIVIPNDDGTLRPGMPVQITLLDGPSP